MRDRISKNIKDVERRIARAAERAGRDPGTVRLVPVTKAVGEDEARVLIELGYTELGENRVEDARSKIEALGGKACWHMIGHVQRRKARDVVALFDRVDSVDRLELAKALDTRCAGAGRTLDVLVQVNVAREAAKGGFRPEDVDEAVERIRAMRHLNVVGLMTMAPMTEDPEATRPVFAGLRELGRSTGLRELSMGMTNDFEVAVEEGATEVRVGTALFV